MKSWKVWTIISGKIKTKRTQLSCPWCKGGCRCFPEAPSDHLKQGCSNVPAQQRAPPQMHRHTDITQTWREDKWPRQNLNLAFESRCSAVQPLLQDNSLIERGCWQAFFIIWLLNTAAAWLSYRKLCHTRGSNYVPKEGRECARYACRLWRDYKEYRCVRTSPWQSVLSWCGVPTQPSRVQQGGKGLFLLWAQKENRREKGGWGNQRFFFLMECSYKLKECFRNTREKEDIYKRN